MVNAYLSLKRQMQCSVFLIEKENFLTQFASGYHWNVNEICRENDSENASYIAM